MAGWCSFCKWGSHEDVQKMCIGVSKRLKQLVRFKNSWLRCVESRRSNWRPGNFKKSRFRHVESRRSNSLPGDQEQMKNKNLDETSILFKARDITSGSPLWLPIRIDNASGKRLHRLWPARPLRFIYVYQHIDCTCDRVAWRRGMKARQAFTIIYSNVNRLIPGDGYC